MWSVFFKHIGWEKVPLCMSEIPVWAVCHALPKPHDDMKSLSCAEHWDTAMVDFCRCSPVLPSSSISYCQRCFERDSRDSEIQASRAGCCVCLSFCAVPSATTSQLWWVPSGSPIRQTAFWVGMGQHYFVLQPPMLGNVFACEKTPVFFWVLNLY